MESRINLKEFEMQETELVDNLKVVVKEHTELEAQVWCPQYTAVFQHWWFIPGNTTLGAKYRNYYKYVGPPDCRAEIYADRVARCPLASHGEYADGTVRRTDGRTPDRYITLSARRGQRKKTHF